MQYADIHLPYFKQGDDLSHHLSTCSTVEEALDAHAQQLEFAAELLRKIRDMVAGQGVTIEADTHMIQIEGPDAIIEALIDAKYASRPWDDEEDSSQELETDAESDDEKTGWDSVY